MYAGTANLRGSCTGPCGRGSPPACLVVESRSFELAGSFGKYVVDIKDGRVDITNICGQYMQVPKNQLDNLICELMAIKRKMEVLTFENEMW